MLDTLKIKNLAIIDQTEIRFEKGLNILSGETGAGKSIILEAIALILGGRATSDLVGNAKDESTKNEATVEGLFRIEDLKWVNERLSEIGIDTADGVLLIKRIVSRTGKHRIYINGELATLSNLQKVCEGLVDLCGQHEHQTLLKPLKQMELLDKYANTEKELAHYEQSFKQFNEFKSELHEFLNSTLELTRKKDFLLFQIQELESADLKNNEEHSLLVEKKLLQNAGQRSQHTEDALLALESDESGALSSIKTCLNRLRSLINIEDEVSKNSLDLMTQQLQEAQSLLESVAIQLHKLSSGITNDPGRLEQVQERLALLANLRRKYGTTTQEMIQNLIALKSEAQKLENMSETKAELEQKINESQKNLINSAIALRKKRTKFSKVLADSVTAELKDLKMNEARLEVDLQPIGDTDHYSQNGADEIQFLIKTNKGADLKPLSKVASGGELSRLMLAIRRVIADRGGIGVYLFDEIDTGIGGQTAFEVGKKLQSVSKHNQVICITHLPQVASFADHHLTVVKKTTSQRTITQVMELSTQERKEEIARMLGGPELTKKSLENAAELLSLANRSSL